MNIKAIICFALLVGFHNRVVGSTNVTLVAIGTNTTTLNIATGQLAKVSYLYLQSASSFTINVQGAALSFVSSLMPASPPVIVGPATFTLTCFSPANGSVCTVELSTPDGSFLPSNAVVIPADSGGPVNIILESSADLINWYPSLPGAYGANYTNRFFRVRAQRGQ